MSRVLITGATGFLGKKIAEGIGKDHDLLAIKRSSSDISGWRNADLQPAWIDLEEGWTGKVKEWGPDIIIHSAWIGVEAADRDQWKKQIKNIEFLYDLLEVAKVCGVRKFVGMGSQAEYGHLSSVVSETAPVTPVSAYGAVKVMASQMVRTFCEQESIDWYWLRLFSLMGKGEGDSWLIPSIIRKMVNEEDIDLTEGLQKYAYLYADDLATVIKRIMVCEGRSGIYNISGNNAVTLRNLIEKIKSYMGASVNLNFGVIPYRANQSMLLEGDCGKFVNEIGSFIETPFEEALRRTIDYYAKKFKCDSE